VRTKSAQKQMIGGRCRITAPGNGQDIIDFNNIP
jgi:hypothetical protein